MARKGGEKLNKISAFKILSILLVISLVSVVSYSYGASKIQVGDGHKDPSVSYNVYVFKDGIEIDEAGNTITDIGETWLRSWLGSAGADNTTARSAAQYISLSNDGSASAAWTELPTEIAADGFTRAVGDVVEWTNSGDAAFNVTKTFTASGTQELQTAGLQWDDLAESDNNLFAAADFTQTTFNSDDTLTITWVITVNAN
jgi:hypothetical protein